MDTRPHYPDPRRNVPTTGFCGSQPCLHVVQRVLNVAWSLGQGLRRPAAGRDRRSREAITCEGEIRRTLCARLLRSRHCGPGFPTASSATGPRTARLGSVSTRVGRRVRANAVGMRSALRGHHGRARGRFSFAAWPNRLGARAGRLATHLGHDGVEVRRAPVHRAWRALVRSNVSRANRPRCSDRGLTRGRAAARGAIATVHRASAAAHDQRPVVRVSGPRTRSSGAAQKLREVGGQASVSQILDTPRHRVDGRRVAARWRLVVGVRPI